MKKNNLTFLIHDWNPNGTNDLTIIVNGKDMIGVEEATFGIDINKFDTFELNPDNHVANVPLKVILKSVAVSPVSDGSELRSTLKKLGAI